MLALIAEIPTHCNYDRTTLTGYIDTYFKALVNNNPYAVPLADNVKITMNGDVRSLALTFWESAESIVNRPDKLPAGCEPDYGPDRAVEK